MMGSLACGIGGLMIAELDRRGAFDDGSWCGEGRKEGRKEGKHRTRRTLTPRPTMHYKEEYLCRFDRTRGHRIQAQDYSHTLCIQMFQGSTSNCTYITKYTNTPTDILTNGTRAGGTHYKEEYLCRFDRTRGHHIQAQDYSHTLCIQNVSSTSLGQAFSIANLHPPEIQLPIIHGSVPPPGPSFRS